ncbi:hypothetical protein EDD18DRAFT_172284 [Armillaria luteobubalina]|uniref:Uncharacterized protein n=1 Tax=Armillaria luteobubalina TaxID=153913 RepID=A0AA39UPA8_9AGAR|nr:hypothetical protein EDD18DRAFT_172284 [Armillaria luteobubalina]
MLLFSVLSSLCSTSYTPPGLPKQSEQSLQTPNCLDACRLVLAQVGPYLVSFGPFTRKHSIFSDIQDPVHTRPGALAGAVEASAKNHISHEGQYRRDAHL